MSSCCININLIIWKSSTRLYSLGKKIYGIKIFIIFIRFKFRSRRLKLVRNWAIRNCFRCILWKKVWFCKGKGSLDISTTTMILYGLINFIRPFGRYYPRRNSRSKNTKNIIACLILSSTLNTSKKWYRQTFIVPCSKRLNKTSKS